MQNSIPLSLFVVAVANVSRRHSDGMGQNTLLINERMGSGLFLGEIFTTLPLTLSSPRKKYGACGACSKCQSACPTAAFTSPYVLDARKCISYLTIEHSGSIPEALRPLMGNHIYGCDVCQQVGGRSMPGSGRQLRDRAAVTTERTTMD